MNKNFYEKPTVDLLVVRFEENILSNYNTQNHTQYITGDDYEEL